GLLQPLENCSFLNRLPHLRHLNLGARSRLSIRWLRRRRSRTLFGGRGFRFHLLLARLRLRRSRGLVCCGCWWSRRLPAFFRRRRGRLTCRLRRNLVWRAEPRNDFADADRLIFL